GGTPWVIAAGTSVSSDVEAGAKLCLRLTVNASGAITDLVVVRADATSTLRLCGVVTAYAEADATSTGSLTIGGRTLDVAINVDLPAAVRVGADLCATFELNGFGQIRDGEVTANATSTVRICGVVSAYAEATPTKTGSLSIGSRNFVVAMGADLPAAVRAGADLCATLELNAFGQIQDGNVTANVTSTVQICGVVDAFTKATATKTGSLTIDGRRFLVAMGADLPAAVKAGADLCATLELNAFGQVQDGTVTANVGSTLTVCGQVTAFAAASANQNGSLTIGGMSKTIAAGGDVDSRVEVGAFVKLRLTLNAIGQINEVTVLRVGVSLSDACDGPSATASPTPTPTPVSSPGTTPSPTPTPGTTPSPTPTPEPGATPTPTPVDVLGPTPDPIASPTSDGGPTEVCPPVDGGPTAAGGDAGGSNSGPAPELPDTASAVERAGRVIASAAVPFMLFLMGIFVATAIAWWRRQTAYALAVEEAAE
ncbi:MAG TPA: hypothetical protein VMM13_19780, partial [Euzebya sp.]|nr:hypothetical protein [Euzebya sp.]